ncbi:DsbA family oxidoreductase [Vibrio sp. 10N.261.55.A7]|uniref:DsbA family oxidoreductase n=1 Tax=Vibrio sp. 10N.261.55.A7 TaxID=1880851 RepID=UPI000C85AD71|nr:DsbA family oxidoreductase [Vibrio sp. 10N.261.55.A7]PMJ91536.1 thioredoxin [Vibrio sp. 10N.261.55.A7]
MTNKIKLDIISDVVCPWCVVGYKHLEAAIQELGLQDKVEIEWQPFELNPDMPIEGEELGAHLQRKYGSTREDSDRVRSDLTQRGEQYGFKFDYFDGMKMVNTLDAHVLLDMAHALGKQTDLKLRLFAAFFTERKDISDRDVLINEAQSVGINAEQAREALDDKSIRDRIRQTEQQWQQMNISGVPTVVFNRTSAMTGAQPQEGYKQVLLELLEAQLKQ